MRGTHALTLQHLMSSFGGPQTVEGRKAPRQRLAESYLKYVAQAAPMEGNAADGRLLEIPY
jgi:hypothetical protein